jgi:flagellar hook-associated protein FlgK
MAKSSSKSARASKPKPERKKANGKGTKPAKPTGEVLSDQQRQALLFSHKRKLVPLLAAEANAKAAVTKAYELAKKEGVPKKEIKLAIQLDTEEGIETAKKDLESFNRIARWLGVGKQLSLFGDAETQAQRHFEDGRRAALNDEPAKPPAHLHQKDAQSWLEGHAAGRLTLNTDRVLKMTPNGQMSLGEAAAGVVGKLGTEAPTHAEVH